MIIFFSRRYDFAHALFAVARRIATPLVAAAAAGGRYG